MVGPAGFEPATSCTPSKRASQAALRPDHPDLAKAGIIQIYSFPCSLAHVSRSVTVRLKTGAPGFESGSTQK